MGLGMVELHMPKGVYKKSTEHGAALSDALKGNRNAVKHGLTSRTHRSPEYLIWQAMRQRCNNPAHPNYANYGGRGIKVCPQWDEFTAFLAHIGPRPEKGLQLDRIDNERGYEPDNVRWATRQDQMLNTRRTKMTEEKYKLIHSSALSSVKLSKMIDIDASFIRKIRRGEVVIDGWG